MISCFFFKVKNIQLTNSKDGNNKNIIEAETLNSSFREWAPFKF